jgi:hypothetical protein
VADGEPRLDRGVALEVSDMKGYGGATPPAKTEEIKTADGTPLAQAMEEIDFMNKLGASVKRRFLRLPPGWGVKWCSYEREGEQPMQIKTLVEVGRLNYNIGDQDIHLYPATPFLTMPTVAHIVHTVVLVIRFADAVAMKVMWTPEAESHTGALKYRIGSTHDNPSALIPVIEIKSADLKVVKTKE